MAGIYLHIPFCKQACSYCDFYFITSLQYRDAFVNRMVREIRSYRNTPFVEHTFETIYLGGGTPSVLSVDQIDRILQTIRETFPIEPKEVTMEMNPDNVTTDYLNGLLNVGIQRASMGVQSFQPDLLEFMHRAHDRREALECFEILSKTGFPSYSVDLIYGNPNQTLDQLDRDLDQLITFDPPHVSAYSLTIEPDTRLGKQHELGRLDPLPDENVAEHFERVVKRLEEAGMYQYEVSNFSKPGSEALHNSGYWTHENYLGMGPAAHSFWWPEGQDRAVRWENKPDIRSYLSEEVMQEHKKRPADSSLQKHSSQHSSILSAPGKPSRHRKYDSNYTPDSSGQQKEADNKSESDMNLQNAGDASEDRPADRATGATDSEDADSRSHDSEATRCPTPQREEEFLSLDQLAEERIMMGLRTRSGVTQRELEQTYQYKLNNNQRNYLQRKMNEGKLRSKDPIRLSREGLKIADSIILDLVSM